MELNKYKDLSGDGGIMGYFFLEDGIIIKFSNSYYYLYNYENPGGEHVEKMKKLAAQGQGLKTYINKYVRDNYAYRFDKLPPSLAA